MLFQKILRELSNKGEKKEQSKIIAAFNKSRKGHAVAVDALRQMSRLKYEIKRLLSIR